MSQITIRFIGICVHVTIQPLEVPHRVLFLSHDGSPIEGHDVKAHTPLLFLPEPREIKVPCVGPPNETKTRYPLQRVRMLVLNAIGNLEPEPSYLSGLPRLSRPGATLPPNLPVIQDGQPPAAAYFDLTAGRLSACIATNGGAIGTTVDIETDGDPVVRFTCFDDKTAHDELTFASGSVIQMFNTADDKDGDDDYLINYFVCNPYPPAADRVPPKTSLGLPLCFDGTEPPIRLDLSPMCSNTGFP